MIKSTFDRPEKLKSEKVIKQLFTKGKGAYKYPFKLVILKGEYTSEDQMPQVMVSVSKRNFKRAVDRNRIKRQIREAYRLNKAEWLGQLDNKPAYLAIIYIAKEFNDTNFLKKKLLKVLKMLPDST